MNAKRDITVAMLFVGALIIASQGWLARLQRGVRKATGNDDS